MAIFLDTSQNTDCIKTDSWFEIDRNPGVNSIEMRCPSLIVDEEECGEEAQEGEPGQHRHGVRRKGVQSRQDAVHFVW